MMETFTIEDITKARDLGNLMDSLESVRQSLQSIQDQIDVLGLTEEEQSRLLKLRDKLKGLGLN